MEGQVNVPIPVPVGVVITDSKGNEWRYDRHMAQVSIMGLMLAEDSAIRAFTKSFAEDPVAVRLCSASLDGG